MASTGNLTPDFLILSPTPYPLGHMLPTTITSTVKRWINYSRDVFYWTWMHSLRDARAWYRSICTRDRYVYCRNWESTEFLAGEMCYFMANFTETPFWARLCIVTKTPVCKIFFLNITSGYILSGNISLYKGSDYTQTMLHVVPVYNVCRSVKQKVPIADKELWSNQSFQD